jgi:hypothetical protein
MSDRVAILVIHGIGTQKPYETLDQFARGLTAMLPKPAPEGKGVEYDSQIRFRQHDEDPAHQQKAWTQAFVRLTPAEADDDGHGPETIDLIEYYWAPIINGRVSAAQSLEFLVRSALGPFDYLRANMLVIDEVSGKTDGAAARIKHEGFSNSKTKQLLFILLREIYRSVLIFFPMILLCAGLYVFLAQPLLTMMTPGGSPAWLHYFWTCPVPRWNDAVVLALVGLRWLLMGMALKYFWDGRAADPGTTVEQKAALRQCSMVVGLLLLLLLALPWLLGSATHTTAAGLAVSVAMPGWLAALAAWVSGAARAVAMAPMCLRLGNLAVCGLLALLAYGISRFLTTGIGDLAVYLGADTLSTSFDARSQIMSECTATVEDLLEPHADLPAGADGIRRYDRVLLAAHSLGSVIAYDVLNDLITKEQAGRAPGAASSLGRITALFTFGCPLNKVYYFFRSRTARATTVLTEILFDLHNFRLRVPPPPGVHVAPSPFAPGFRWFNAWSGYDVISGRMLFYQADENRRIVAGHEPVSAHTGYWDDPELYRFFAGLL